MANASPRAVASSSANHATVPCSPRVPGVRQSERVSVYERITTEIITAIERGAGDWKMPWHHDGAATHRPLNAATGKPYRGLNVLALWAAAEGRSFASGLWGTYRQWVRRAKSHERSGPMGP